MDEFIKILDKNVEYESHEIIEDTCYIKIKSTREYAKCPYCNSESKKVHSKYNRTIQDLPMQGKKVILIINNRKYRCLNAECGHKTFSERYEFLRDKSKKTRRIEEEIIRISLNCSSVAAAHLLSQSVVKVSKSTICELIKKSREQNR